MEEQNIRIMFIAKGASDFWKWVEIGTGIQDIFGKTCKILIVSSINIEEKIPSFIEYKNAYEDFPDFQQNCRDKSRREIADELYKYADCILPTAYMSDERAILKSETDFSLAAEQLFLIERGLGIFDSFSPTHMFVSGAGTMIRTVFFALAGAKCRYRYRVLTAHHMTPSRRDMRYFFCDNDLGDINDTTPPLFRHDERELEIYASTILDSILNRKYRMDSYARTTGRYWRVSRPGFGMCRDFFRMLKCLINGDRLQYKSSKSKLVFTSRSISQKGIFDPVSSLQKPYVLFPLNVPNDAQLRLRAKEWQDTESLIRLFAANMPYGVQPVIKAHPGNPGTLPGSLISRLRRDFPDIRFISHDHDLRTLLEDCAAVVVVNGTAALEASLLEKPCIYLGASYLGRLPNAYRIRSIAEIEKTIIRCIRDAPGDCTTGTREILKKFYAQTYPPLHVREANDLSKINHMIANGIIELITRQSETGQFKPAETLKKSA